jgi:hypothetical protein
MTKFLPLIFLPYFAVKGKWRALAGSLIVIIPVALVAESSAGIPFVGAAILGVLCVRALRHVPCT